MLIPSAAVMIAVIATKIADLTSGAVSLLVLMFASPQNHPGSAEQRRGEQAAPGGQRGRRSAQRERGQFPNQFAVGDGRAALEDGRPARGNTRPARGPADGTRHLGAWR